MGCIITLLTHSSNQINLEENLQLTIFFETNPKKKWFTINPNP